MALSPLRFGEENVGEFGTPFVPGTPGLVPDPSPTPATRAGAGGCFDQIYMVTHTLSCFASVVLFSALASAGHTRPICDYTSSITATDRGSSPIGIKCLRGLPLVIRMGLHMATHYNHTYLFVCHVRKMCCQF